MFQPKTPALCRPPPVPAAPASQKALRPETPSASKYRPPRNVISPATFNLPNNCMRRIKSMV